MNKKGALELSITGIVVMIIAITVLSLAIVFIRGMFSKATGTFEQQFTQIERQLLEDMKNTGELMVVNIPFKQAIIGKPQQMYIAIKNTQNEPRLFNIAAVCNPGWGGAECGPGMSDSSCLAGGDEDVTEFSTCGDPSPWFPLGKIPKQVNVPAGESVVLPITVQTTVEPDTYSLEFQVWVEDSSAEGGASEYGTETAFIEVVAG